MTLVGRLAGEFFPNLKGNLLKAKIEEDPQKFLRKRMISSLYLSCAMGILTFLFVQRMELSILIVPILFIIWFSFIFLLLVKSVDAAIEKRRKHIDRDVLFAGRFLLVKLNSGKSLVNALEEASKSFGVASSYWKEVMKDIDLGTPVEKALERATKNCPSELMRNILFQITNAMEIGIDVGKILESILDDISQRQLLEIEAYGKKLSSVALFYMLFAVVLPSLGTALGIVMSSLVSLNVGTTELMMMAFFMIVIEVFFIMIFKIIRPNINI